MVIHIIDIKNNEKFEKILKNLINCRIIKKIGTVCGRFKNVGMEPGTFYLKKKLIIYNFYDEIRTHTSHF
jgi:hypothetical protein